MACPVEPSCAYSAPRLYGGLLERGEHGWPLSVLLEEFSPGALEEVLRDGPYGRCVYDFLTQAERQFTSIPAGAMPGILSGAEGHGGGDGGLMDAFTGAVATGNRDLILSGP